ncbi:2'-5' RNA ligase family protein [Rhodococcus sp. 24CO]|uniref:2'-5' RNA ligase family protein n=1 Tax=Rhodococcus sp. 24CO TaxID=3117460 RepID=UPI003D356519
MVQSVELLLGESSESAIRGQWSALADAGLPSQGKMVRESNRPHITLFVARSIPPEVDEVLTRRFSLPPFEIRLGGYIVFGGRQFVLARSVIPSRALLRLHRDVFDAAAGSSGIPGHIEPGTWTPHVTLARRIEPDQLGGAISLLSKDVIAGDCGPIRRWDGDARVEWSLTPPG